jgi:hypothetical protein
MVRAQRQTSMSARSDFRLRRCQLGRRQVFAPQHAVCYVLCCNGAAFSWKSALAPILALSTSEAELISVASCAQEVNFCRNLTTELGFIQPGLTPIAEDNTGAIALFKHGHFKGRSKHVHLRWYFVCDYIDTGVLRLVQTPTRDQLADLRTKACCSSAQVPAFSSSRWSFTRSSPRQEPRLHGGSPSLGLSGFSLTRRVWYSPPCLSPLLCILAYLSLGGVFDDSLIHSHITTHLHSFERGGVSSIELGCSILAVT